MTTLKKETKKEVTKAPVVRYAPFLSEKEKSEGSYSYNIQNVTHEADLTEYNKATPAEHGDEPVISDEKL